MSNYLILNLQDFDLSQKITDTIKPFATFCICCFGKNKKFVRLTKCKHTDYLSNYYNVEVDLPNQIVCYDCHNMMVKIEAFQKMVEQSAQIMNSEEFDKNNLPNLKPYKNPLKISETSFVNLTEDDKVVTPTDEAVSVEVHLPSFSEPIVTIHEGEDRSMLVEGEQTEEIDIETAKILPIKKKKKRKDSVDVKLEGKIRIVTLTHDDMMYERELDSTYESYVKLPYKCVNCVVGFDHEINFNGHMTRHHVERKGGVVCNICKSVLASEVSHKRHLKTHYTRYDCEECGKRYINVKSAIEHYSVNHDNINVTYKCKQCDFVACTMSAFAYHRNKHKMHDLECEECGKNCSSPANLKRHLFAVHKKSNRTFVCPVCSKTYHTKSGLVHHSSTAHGDRLPPEEAYCVTCNVQFNSVRCYKVHLKQSSKHISEDSKKYACDKCDFRFAAKSSLTRHIECVHTKSFEYKCPQCPRAFRTQSLMIKHVQKIHDKVPRARNKICQHCGKGFMSTQVLRCHIRTHTGARPLKCDMCTATYAHPAALYTHKLRHRRAQNAGATVLEKNCVSTRVRKEEKKK